MRLFQRLLIILAAITGTASASLEAQDQFKAFYFGVTGGAGYSAVLFDPSGPDGIVAPVFGGVFRFESPERKSLQVELRYRQGGWKESSGYERNLGILELPITANIALGKKKVRPFLTLGETLTYVTSESETIPEPGGQIPIFEGLLIDNKFGFALNGGLGIGWHSDKSIIEFETRATFHVTSLYETPNELGLSNSSPFFIEGVLRYLFRWK